jgi:hypothetical protein
VGVEGEVKEPSVQLFQAMTYANDLVPLGPHDGVKFMRSRREAVIARRNRFYGAGSVIVFIVFLVIIGFMEGNDVCCSMSILVGLVAVTVAIVTFIGWGTVLEEDHGYWKRSDQEYRVAIEKLQTTLVFEDTTFERCDVARFFDVDVPTTFYLLDMEPPPVYVIVWKDEDKAMLHLGPRTDDDPDRLKELASKIAWAV